jgi:hypothetical protein
MNGQKTVDEYIAAFDDWRTDAMKRLREVVKEGAPHSAVAIKWAQPVWEWNGPMIWMKAYPKHVDIGFWRGTEMEDPKKVLTGEASGCGTSRSRRSTTFPRTRCATWSSRRSS